MKRMIKIMSILISMLIIAGCGHEHSFIEATCDEPKKCSECGEAEGEALGHNFIEATCDEPKKCSECGEIEGEALGHTTEMGRCDYCHVVIREDVILEIMDKSFKAIECSTNASNYLSEGLDYMACLSASTELKRLEKYIREMIELCEDYELVKDVKRTGNTILGYIPERITGDSANEIKDFVSDVVLCLKEMQDLSLEFKDISGILAE